jgi:hypothetical protein
MARVARRIAESAATLAAASGTPGAGVLDGEIDKSAGGRGSAGAGWNASAGAAGDIVALPVASAGGASVGGGGVAAEANAGRVDSLGGNGGGPGRAADGSPDGSKIGDGSETSPPQSREMSLSMEVIHRQAYAGTCCPKATYTPRSPTVPILYHCAK